MDPNQNQTQNLNQQIPIQVNENIPSQPNVDISPQPKSPKFLLPLLVLFVLLFISALIMFFANRFSPVTTSGRAVKPPIRSPLSITSEPAVSEEEQELNSIDLGDIDKDLQDIQADVDQL